MGTLSFITSQHIAEIDDRTLAHLQIVICNKLRRDEKFLLTLAPADGTSGPVTVLWMTSALSIIFTYTLPTRHPINTAWLHLLADAAATNTGLWVVPEPDIAAAPEMELPTHRERVLA